MTSLCAQQNPQASVGLVSGLEGQNGCSETWTSWRPTWTSSTILTMQSLRAAEWWRTLSTLIQVRQADKSWKLWSCSNRMMEPHLFSLSHHCIIKLFPREIQKWHMLLSESENIVILKKAFTRQLDNGGNIGGHDTKQNGQCHLLWEEYEINIITWEINYLLTNCGSPYTLTGKANLTC